MLPERPFSPYAWGLRVALIAAVIAVLAGVPVWLEAILWLFLLAIGIWSLREGRQHRRARERTP
jgi:membrane protein implicated in regulation of membrane protease activity